MESEYMNTKTDGAQNFTDGPILSQLIRFSVPVLFALLLQATYYYIVWRKKKIEALV